MPIQHNYIAHGVTVVAGFSRIRRLVVEYDVNGTAIGTVLVQGFPSTTSYLADPNDPLAQLTSTAPFTVGANNTLTTFLQNYLLTLSAFTGGTTIPYP